MVYLKYMNRVRANGFTVIETMLFLAVSGMLIIGVLIGAGGAINAQRYKDATNSLLSYFQGEYDRVANVQNVRGADLTCAMGASSLDVVVDSAVARGSTDCVIIGRLLTVSEGGSIVAQTVYASNDVVSLFSETGAPLGSDAEAIASAGLFVDEENGESFTYQPEWGTKIVQPGSNTTGVWQTIIVRSPASGAIRTYTADDTNLTLAQLVNKSHETERLICLDSRGLVISGNRGVVFSAGATGAASVKLVGDGQC